MFVFNQLKVPTNVEEAAEDDPLAEVYKTKTVRDFARVANGFCTTMKYGNAWPIAQALLGLIGFKVEEPANNEFRNYIDGWSGNRMFTRSCRCKSMADHAAKVLTDIRA